MASSGEGENFRARVAAFYPESLLPRFDPLDGGLSASILFLLEKPGPRVAETGLISIRNPDPTARATRAFMQEANIAPTDRLLWNAVPWWNGTTKITGPERKAGIEAYKILVGAMRKLQTIVLVGKRAAEAHRRSGLSGFATFESAHPSGQVRAAFPERWTDIPRIWTEAGLAASEAAI